MQVVLFPGCHLHSVDWYGPEDDEQSSWYDVEPVVMCINMLLHLVHLGLIALQTLFFEHPFHFLQDAVFPYSVLIHRAQSDASK